MDSWFYEMCGNDYCYHFVDEEDAWFEDQPTFFIHLDDGEKEHDHDAIPSEKIHRLSWWKKAYPHLFTEYADGKIGPNSKHFR